MSASILSAEPDASALLAALLAAGLAGWAVLLAQPGSSMPGSSLPSPPMPRPGPPPPAEGGDPSPGAAGRSAPALGVAGVLVAAVLAGILVGGPVGVVAALGVGGAGVRHVRRAGRRAERQAQARAADELPHLVVLLASGLRGGASPAAALATAAAALPGPAADRVAGACRRLVLGVDPAEVWSGLAADPALGPLGRTLARAHTSGASVVEAVDRLAAELGSEARARVEERARTVGVRAALPLGLCLLPAFLLLGIVPLAAGLLSTVAP